MINKTRAIDIPIMIMGDSHVAGKKYWIISQVVEVITSKSNEIYHEWPEATSDKFHYFYK